MENINAQRLLPSLTVSPLLRKNILKRNSSPSHMGYGRLKKVRRYKCKSCEYSTDSPGWCKFALPQKSSPLFPVLFAIVCSTIPCSLRRHKYTHLEQKHHCRTCNKFFAFESDLESHKLKHRRHPGFQCQKKVDGQICGKWYFAKSDLEKHVKTHLKIVHSCEDCSYTTYDIRYLRAHKYKHLNILRYHCSQCNSGFKHHTQLRRHVVKAL